MGLMRYGVEVFGYRWNVTTVELQLASGCGGGWSVASALNGKGLVVDNVLHVLKAGMCKRASVK